MKTTLLALFILAAATAFGQTASSISSQVVIQPVPDHPQHADMRPMATEQSLVGGGSYSYAQGERPLWEFGPLAPPPPSLGNVARACRKEKTAVKKAEIVFEKQGS
jgi:hypothetical protein